MKRCPTCQRTYEGETQLYCFDDGTFLQDAPEITSPPDDLQKTVDYREVKIAGENRGEEQKTVISDRTLVDEQQWNRSRKVLVYTDHRRRVWPWIVGIVVTIALVVVGGIAFLAILIYIGVHSDNGNMKNRNKTSTVPITNANTSSSSEKRADFNDDFSVQKWWVGTDSNGSFWYQNGEYHGKAVPGRWVTKYSPPQAPYDTRDATITVTTRAVNGTSPVYGYGIAVHGHPIVKKYGGYSFLIKSDYNPTYAIVMHDGENQTYLRNWTPSAAINTGATPNQLQVVTNDSTLSFYINGNYVDSIPDSAGFKAGRVGVYTSDTSEVAFDNLNIKH